MPPKRRSSPTTAPSAKKPRAKANDTEEAYVEGDAWLLPALHKHGGEDFAAVAADPAFDGPRRGRTAEELEVALTQWMSRPMRSHHQAAAGENGEEGRQFRGARR